MAPPPDACELPTNAVCCVRTGGEGRAAASPSPSPSSTRALLGLVGYGEAVAAAEAAFRRHFPGLKWLSELDPDNYEGSSGGSKPPRGTDEDDAIDQLEQALGNIQPQQAT